MKCYNKFCPMIAVPDDGYECDEIGRCPIQKCDLRKEAETSIVDHPIHYQGSYECIDLMREIYGDDAVRSFCICNAYKYRFRAGHKPNEAAQTDIAKAEWYEAYVMEHLMKNNVLQWERRMADDNLKYEAERIDG